MDRSPIAFAAPVVEVTLTEDRAQVFRKGRAALPAGRLTLRVSDVAPVLSDKTVWAKILSGPDGAKVEDVRVRRERIVLREHEPAAVRELRERLEGIGEEIALRSSRIEILNRQFEDRMGLASQLMKEWAEDTGRGAGGRGTWSPQTESLAKAEREIRDRVLEEAFGVEELSERQDVLRARLAAMENPSTAFKAALEADVFLPAAGECEIRFAYVAPGACWRPCHTARLTPAKGEGGRSSWRVAFRTDGCVWQNTGENWKDARLSFSTERPSLGAEPPALASDVVQAVKKSPQVVIQVREQDVKTTGLGGGGAAEAPEMPGIDDGGVTLQLQGASPATVPSDGKPCRVPLLEFEAEAETEMVAMAELAACVFLKSIQTNTSGRPILAGPVELIRESGYVGRTSTLFIAPGEKFPLNWGADMALRVHRQHEQHVPEKNLLGTWTSTDHLITVRLSNLGREEKTAIVRERIPVSEVEQVQIEVDEKNTTGGKKPDAQGFLEWSLRLKGRAQEQVKLRYTFRKRSNVAGA